MGSGRTEVDVSDGRWMLDEERMTEGVEVLGVRSDGGLLPGRGRKGRKWTKLHGDWETVSIDTRR